MARQHRVQDFITRRVRLAHVLVLAAVSLPWLAAGCGVTSPQRETQWYKQQLTQCEEDRNRLELELAQAEQVEKNWSDRTAGLRADLDRAKVDLAAAQREVQALRNAEPVAIRHAAGPSTDDPSDFKGIPGVTATRGEDDEIRVTLEQQILFSPGSVAIRKQGLETIVRIAEVLGRNYAGREIRVEGHTDNVPPQKVRAQYPTNWELSTARACQVLRSLVDTGMVDDSRAAAVGYADQRPVADNATKEGRSENRRVEVVVVRR